MFISVACNLSVDLVSTRPPFVYSWLKIFINDLVEFVPVCTWFGWLLHISFTCQSPLIYIPSLLLLPPKMVPLNCPLNHLIGWIAPRWDGTVLADSSTEGIPIIHPGLLSVGPFKKKRRNRGNGGSLFDPGTISLSAVQKCKMGHLIYIALNTVWRPINWWRIFHISSPELTFFIR